jgi:hypothetical protein
MTGATPVIAFVGGAGTSSSVESIGSGWFRLSFVSTSVTAANTNRVYLLPAYGGASANGETSIFWGVQAENSTSVTAYQRVGTDKMTVWAGVFKRSDAAAAIISELSATISGNNGAFWLVGPSAAAADYGFRSKGTSLADCDLANIYAAPRFDVLCGIGDIAADTCKLRLNGVDNSVATDQGSGNYGNYPLYVGRRNNASLPFSGRLYGLIIRGVQTTDSKIREFEKYTARLTGKTI